MRYIYLLLLLICLPNMLRGQARENTPLAVSVAIDRILVEGNTITRTSVILREIGIHEGDYVSADSLDILNEQIKLRLFNLQLFNEVEPRHEDFNGRVVWHIKVKERWFILPSVTIQFADRNFNTWFVKQHNDLRRVMAGLTITDKNFRGNLENLAVTVQAGYTQKLAITYMRPYVNSGQTSGLGFTVSMAQSRQAYFATDSNKLVYAGNYTGPVISHQFEGGINYMYRPAYATRHIFQLSYKDYGVSDTILKLNPDYYSNKSMHARFMELSYRFEYNGVDNWSYSLKGQKVVVTGIARSGFEGLNTQAFATVEAGLFRGLGSKWYISAIFRGRVMYPQQQPYFFQGGLGTQTDYVRGYEYYIIDGSNYGLLRLDLKRELFRRSWSFPVRYFTALPLRIYPKVFADAGYIDCPVPGNSYLSNKLIYSYGVGLDIVTLYDIKIRLEYSWNHLSQNGLYLHFNSE